MVARKNGHKLTTVDAERIKDAIRVRAKELIEQAGAEEPVDGTIVPELDPADPWALRIEEIASADDAEAVASEVDDAVSSGELALEKETAVRAAIAAREAAVSQSAAA